MAYKDELLAQLKDQYGKIVYTYTCHLKMADRFQNRESKIQIAQIILSAFSTGSIVDMYITKEFSWVCAVSSSLLLVLNSYVKIKNFSTLRSSHVKAANALWKIREEYICLMTDLAQLEEEKIVERRDHLVEKTAIIYDNIPTTDKKSYEEAQKALKNEEEQFFSNEELNKILPKHLRNY